MTATGSDFNSSPSIINNCKIKKHYINIRHENGNSKNRKTFPSTKYGQTRIIQTHFNSYTCNKIKCTCTDNRYFLFCNLENTKKNKKYQKYFLNDTKYYLPKLTLNKFHNFVFSIQTSASKRN